MKKKQEWWEEPFRKGWYPLESISLDWQDRTAVEVVAILKHLKLEPKSRILDVGCGTGRHSLELAKRGFAVTGIDVSPVYLKTGTLKAKKLKLSLEFKKQDMRQLPFQDGFDAAVNLFSSFGYFSRSTDDLKMIQEIYKTLRPGGRFLIDNLNYDFLKSGFVSNSWVRLGDGTLVLENRQPLAADRISRTEWIFVSPTGARHEMRSEIRGYSPNDLKKLLQRAGFKKIRRVDSLAGVTRGRSCPRTVLVATK